MGAGSPVPPDLLTPTRWADVSIHVKSSRKINSGRLKTAVGGISISKACQFQNVNEKNPVTSFSNLNPYPTKPFPAPVNMGIPRNISSGNNKESAYFILQNLQVKNVDKILVGHIGTRLHTFSVGQIG